MDVCFYVTPNWEGRSEPHTVGSILRMSHFIFVPLLSRPNIQVERTHRMVPPYSSTGQTCPVTWLFCVQNAVVSPVLCQVYVYLCMLSVKKNFAAPNVSV